MKVQEIMTRNVRCCASDTNLAEAVSYMWEGDCGIIPVVDNDGKVVGMITDRDISIAVATRGRLASEITAGEVISGNIYTCLPENDVKEALEAMRSFKVRRLPVVDNGGRLQGILSLNDVVVQVGEAKKKNGSAISSKDVADTLKALCEHPKQKTAAAD